MLEIPNAKKERLEAESNGLFKPAQGSGPSGTKQIIVLCGPSHSGKSTFAKRFSHQFTVINSDEIRKQLTGKYALSEHEDSVWAEFSARKRRALRAGRNIILDACHLTQKARQHSLEGVNDKYKKICVVFDLPFSFIKERCIREKRVTLAKVREIWGRFKKPTRQELRELGFDQAYFIRAKEVSPSPQRA